MRLILLAVVTLIAVNLWGCKVDVPISSQFAGESFSTETYDAFEGFPEGVPTVYRFSVGYFNCNPVDNFIYLFDTGAAELNIDSSQVTCTTTLFFHTDVTVDTRPIADQP